MEVIIWIVAIGAWIACGWAASRILCWSWVNAKNSPLDLTRGDRRAFRVAGYVFGPVALVTSLAIFLIERPRRNPSRNEEVLVPARTKKDS